MIYVDGSPAESATATLPVVQNMAPFLLGGAYFSGSPTGLFSGLIDELQVYGRALSANEVDFLFHHPTETFRQLQEITFAPIADRPLASPPFALSASSSSGLPVTFNVLSGPAVVTGNTLSLLGVGQVAISAIQVGTAIYAPASATQSFNVSKGEQSISFPPLPTRWLGDGPLALTATAGSGLPVNFSIINGPATIDGNIVTPTAVGEITIRASQPGNANYNAAPSVERDLTVNRRSQTIAFPGLGNRNFGEGTFGIHTASNSGLPITFNVVSGPATLAGVTVTLTGAGTVVIRASQGGDNYYDPAPSVEQSLVVGKAKQTIHFEPIGTRNPGAGAFALQASASSGLPVHFSIISGPATVAGNILTPSGMGMVVVRASQAGDSNYHAADSIDQTFVLGRTAQVISFAPLGNRIFGEGTFAISAIANSGLPVAFSVVSGPATINGPTVTMTGSAVVVIRASQGGDANYEPAAEVERSFVVGKGSQTITFESIGNKVFGQSPFLVHAASSAGLPVSFTIISGPATVNGNEVTLNGAGTVVVRAMQGGDGNYGPAADVEHSFLVSKTLQTITFEPIANKVFGQSPFLVHAAASAGLPVSFTIISGPATVNGNEVTLTGAGTVVVRAVQGGDGTYESAVNVEQSFVVGKASQTITFEPIANKVFGQGPFLLGAASSAGLPVSFTLVSGPATVNGNEVTLNGAGTVQVRASQAGDANYSVAPDVDRGFEAEVLLSLSVDGDGTIEREPNGPSYTNGTVVNLRAVPSPNNRFTGWTGSSTETNSEINVVVLTNSHFEATFVPRVPTVPRLDVTSATLTTEGFQITLEAEAGLRYEIEVTTDLINWQSLLILTNSAGNFSFVDRGATTANFRFYRVKVLP